jgi:tetratricopeptide (TPR) repeat protein
MLCGVFRTKERKVIAAILGTIIVIGFIIISMASKGGQIDEQAVMAENYLNAGSYEHAVEAYQKALSMKNSDQETLSIGLSRAYVGLEDFDKALEVLRTCYQKKSTMKLEKEIEEVASAKLDYEFLQSISRADVYFSNKEYDKAISVYEEAKLIKSKDSTSYARIAQAYIDQGKYDLAREEVLDGIEITRNEELDKILITIDTYLLKEDYDLMVTQAEEYVYQENYKDGIEKYQEAILLLPSQTKAYKNLAQIYLEWEKYSEAVTLLTEGVDITEDPELRELLSAAIEQKEAQEERENVLSELYKAMEEQNFEQIIAVMETNIYREQISTGAPVYYGTSEGDISKGEGMIIYKEDQLYYGDVVNGVKKGDGIYFMLTENTYGRGYYYYKGDWNNDIPNGAGKVIVVSNQKKESGEIIVSKTVTEGIYYNALEDGTMNKYFYEDDTETGRIRYLAQNGVPLSKGTTKRVPSPTPATKSYSIGELYQNGENTGDDYLVDPDIVWGVDPFIRSKKK